MYNIEKRVMEVTDNMKRLGYNQSVLSKMVGLPQPTLSQLLNLDRADRLLKNVENVLNDVGRTEHENQRYEVRTKVINRITRDLLGLSLSDAREKLRGSEYQAGIMFEFGLNEMELHICVENVEDLIDGAKSSR